MEQFTNTLELRDVSANDLPIFFAYKQDAEANYMAAFVAEDPADRQAFDAHWAKIMADKQTVNKTIVVDGNVVGHIAYFMQFGEPEISYWIDKTHWGKGIATRALAAFLELIPTRPLYARAVKDNAGSIRVLQKCGFEIVGEDKGFANGRGQEVEEFILKLM